MQNAPDVPVAPPPRPQGALARLFLTSALLSAAVWAGFALGPPMPVQVGMDRIGAVVPAHYQASVFPAFILVVLALVRDIRQGSMRPTWLPRAFWIGSTGLIAVVRLSGALPLSGHAVFLAAAIGHEALPPRDREGRLVILLASAGLVIVGYYKIWLWGDGTWLALSLLTGVAIGAVARAWVLVRMRSCRHPPHGADS